MKKSSESCKTNTEMRVVLHTKTVQCKADTLGIKIPLNINLHVWLGA